MFKQVFFAVHSELFLKNDEERAINQISTAHEMRVAHKNAQEQRDQEQRDQEKRDQKNRDQKKGDQEKRADEKCIVDLCAEVVKKDAKYPLCNEVLDHFILNRKIHVDAQNWATSGWTPLHCAAMYGRTNTVEHLLSRKANVNVKTTEGMSNVIENSRTCLLRGVIIFYVGVRKYREETADNKNV